MKRCGIYVRVACMEQGSGEQAFAAQEAAGIELCRKNGWRFRVFREVGSPGAVLMKLVDLVKAGTLDYIFVNTWDRLSRNLLQAASIIDEVEMIARREVRIVTSASLNPDTAGADAMAAKLLPLFAQLTAEFATLKQIKTAARRRDGEISDSH